MSSANWIRATLGALVLTCGTVTSPAAASFAEVLRAAGHDPKDVERIDAALDAEVDTVLRRVGRRTSYRHARRVHMFLHRNYFREYDAQANSVAAVLQLRRFNCLSATLFEGRVLERAGYHVQVLELPGHVMLRVSLGERTVDVEATSRDGFDAWYHLDALERMDPLLRRPNTPGRKEPGPYGRSGAGYVLADLEGAAAFAWINAGWRALEERRYPQVGAAVAAAARFHPGLVAEADGVRSLMSRAFRGTYETGDFDAAYDLAAKETRLLPEGTSSADRLIAAALKRVQRDCDRDRPRAALDVVDDVAARLGRVDAVERLERRVLPLVAMTAARAGAAGLALQAAERFSGVEPDPVEGERLLRWVAARLAAGTESPASPGEDWSLYGSR